MNRRSILVGGAAALPLAVAGTVAVAAAATIGDTELVRIGEEFERAAADYIANEPRRRATHAVWRAELERLGISRASDPRYESLAEATGYRATADACNDLTQIMIGLHARMIVLPATTGKAIAMKATAVAWDAGDYGFPGDEDDDPTDTGFWDIVHELRAFGGLPSIAELANAGTI